MCYMLMAKSYRSIGRNKQEKKLPVLFGTYGFVFRCVFLKASFATLTKFNTQSPLFYYVIFNNVIVYND